MLFRKVKQNPMNCFTTEWIAKKYCEELEYHETALDQ